MEPLADDAPCNFQGFAVAHNTEKSMFDYLSENPEKAKYFYKAMRAFAQRPGLEPKHVVDNSAWGSLPQGATGGLTSHVAPFELVLLDHDL